MKRLTRKSKMSSQGFSLIELMVVMVLMSIVVGAVVDQIAVMLQRSRTDLYRRFIPSPSSPQESSSSGPVRLNSKGMWKEMPK